MSRESNRALIEELFERVAVLEDAVDLLLENAELDEDENEDEVPFEDTDEDE